MELAILHGNMHNSTKIFFYKIKHHFLTPNIQKSVFVKNCQLQPSGSKGAIYSFRRTNMTLWWMYSSPSTFIYQAIQAIQAIQVTGQHQILLPLFYDDWENNRQSALLAQRGFPQQYHSEWLSQTWTVSDTDNKAFVWMSPAHLWRGCGQIHFTFSGIPSNTTTNLSITGLEIRASKLACQLVLYISETSKCLLVDFLSWIF